MNKIHKLLIQIIPNITVFFTLILVIANLILVCITAGYLIEASKMREIAYNGYLLYPEMNHAGSVVNGREKVSHLWSRKVSHFSFKMDSSSRPPFHFLNRKKALSNLHCIISVFFIIGSKFEALRASIINDLRSVHVNAFALKARYIHIPRQNGFF